MYCVFVAIICMHVICIVNESVNIIDIIKEKSPLYLIYVCKRQIIRARVTVRGILIRIYPPKGSLKCKQRTLKD